MESIQKIMLQLERQIEEAGFLNTGTVKQDAVCTFIQHLGIK